MVRESNGYVVADRCLDPLLCKPMTGKVKINPTNRVALYAQCVDVGCGPAGLSYQWTLYRRGLNGAWLPINNCEYYTTGPFSVRTEHMLQFLPRCMQCRCGIAMRILSVCPSVRPSVCHTRVL